MEATTDELVTIIGEQTIALRLLREELRQTRETIYALTAANADKTEEGGGK